MDDQRKIRLMVVDDHPMIREGLAAMLGNEADMEVVSQAGSGPEAVALFRTVRPDVVLMDLQMPGGDGVTAIETICAEWPAAKIVALTTYKGDVQAAKAIKAGAKGYLLKGMARAQLTETIRAVNSGRRHIAPEVAAELGMGSMYGNLSEREVEVLRELARGGANKVLAERLGVTEETIKAHMKSIMSKLGAADRSQALVVAVKRGIVNILD